MDHLYLFFWYNLQPYFYITGLEVICKHTDFTKIFLPSNDIVFLTRVILSEGTEQLPKANLHPFEVISKPLPFMKSLLHYCLEEAGSLVCICTSSIQENFPSAASGSHVSTLWVAVWARAPWWTTGLLVSQISFLLCSQVRPGLHIGVNGVLYEENKNSSQMNS